MTCPPANAEPQFARREINLPFAHCRIEGLSLFHACLHYLAIDTIMIMSFRVEANFALVKQHLVIIVLIVSFTGNSGTIMLIIFLIAFWDNITVHSSY